MRRLFLFALIPAFLCGCGGGSYRTAAVSGKITLNGKPFANASVVFSPVAVAGKQDSGPGSGGTTDAEGRYSLKIIGKNTNGAVVGKHKVMISRVHKDDTADDRPRNPKQLPSRQHRNTPIEFDVPAGGTKSADFDLTAS